MKRVYLDYTQRRQVGLATWALLAAGTMLALFFWFLLQQMQARNAELRSRLLAQVKPADAPARHENPQKVKAHQAAKLAIHEIVVPWPALWRSLEAAINPDVHMLALEPDAKTRRVRLRLAAINHAAMWAYMQQLSRQPFLRDVRLVSSEATELGGQPTIAFLVEAAWPS